MDKPQNNDELALTGRMPECGHVVAIDLDVTARARKEFAKNGYDTQTMPTAEALAIFRKDCAVHMETCMRAKKKAGAQ